MYIMYVYNVLLCWVKCFFFFFFLPLQSPTDMGRVQRRGFCELWFVNKGQELVFFFYYSSEYIVKDHDYQWPVFIELCRYLDTSKSFTRVVPQCLNRPKQSVMLRGFCSHYVQSYQSAECWQSKDLILV